MNDFPRNPRSGSALLIVLGVMAILSLLVAGFGRGLRADLRASGGFYEAEQNRQLALSALAASQVERAQTLLYADATGNVYFVSSDDTAESEIAALAAYRQGLPLGRGMLSYRFVMKPAALDLNTLDAAALGRLFEVACGMPESDERSALADAILDWADADSLSRAYGAEEEVYQELVPPRHCRNAPFETLEELLLVNGITPDLLFGYSHPVSIENGLLLGGGLYRFLIGDNSPEAQASVQYILRGVLPDDAKAAEPPAEGFTKVTVLPPVLYLVAEGFMPAAPAETKTASTGEQPVEAASRHTILVKLVLPDTAQAKTYTVADFQENAAGELLAQVLAYGIPEETNEL